MTNYYYFIIATTDHKTGRHYARACKWAENNIINLVHQNPDADIIHPVKTLKEARETAEAWNIAYKNNGTFLFDNAPKF